MTQYVINIGALPNDGTGDPLRTAFNETNLNFDQVFAAGPVLSNVQIANNTILTINTNGNLVLAPNGVGVVQSNVHIVPNLANIRNLGAADRRWSTIYAQYIDTNQINLGNSLVLSGNLSVGGNLSVTGDIVYIGNLVTDAKTIQLANTAGTANAANGSGITVGANDAIATFLFDSATNTWDTNIGLAVNGNITGTGLAVSDATVYGNVNAIDGNFTGNIVVNTVQVGTIQLNPVGGPNTLSAITVVDDTVFEGNVDVDGALFVMGNVSADYFIGDGSQLSNLPVATNSTPGVVALGNGFTLNGSNQVTTSSLYNTNISNPAQHYALQVDTNGVVILPDQSIINGSTLRAVAGSYAGLTTNDGENSWMWVDSNGAYIATQYNETGNSHQWTFDNTGNTTFPTGGLISNFPGLTGANNDSWFVTPGNGTGGISSQDGQQYIQVNDDLFVEIGAGYGTANAFVWQFGLDGTFATSGNISTTGNVSANFFLGNGSQLTGISTANTGNVTFSDQIVIGTGISNLVSGLYLAPSSSSANAVQYLRVRGDISYEPTHIHFDTGNNQYFNQFIGDDNKYVLLSNTGNIVINTDDYAGNTAQWTFDTTGNLSAPGNVSAVGNVTGAYILGNGSGLTNLPAPTVTQDITSTGDMSIMTYDGVIKSVNYATVEPSSGNIKGGNIFTLGNVTGGNITTTGIVSATGNIIAGNILVVGSIRPSGVASPAPSLSGFSSVSSITVSASGNVTSGNVLTAGLISATGNITGNYILGNGSQLTGLPATYGNANVATFLAAYGSNSISTSGNVTAQNFIGNGAGLTNVTVSLAGNIVGTQPNVTLVAGAYDWTFDNTGNLTLPGNTFAVNYANNTSVDVVTRFEGTWTVPTGNSTQSFTVSSGTYSMWVEGNIPNGIIAWNATATVTNTNVPVAGAQYAWVYNGGGTPIDFTSIPNQFEGTANTIVRSNVAPSTTTNRFDFGINNTSGGNVTVRYGWIQIS
jgi:hypothetical protein